MISTTDINVKVKLQTGAVMPAYATAEAAGADLHANCILPVVVPARGRVLVPTGVHLELMPGYEAQVRPRSGLALKKGITVLNTPGTVDSDYRGEVGVILFNSSDDPFVVNHGDRIAQLVVVPVSRAQFEEVQELGPSDRGQGGFGSTGV